MPDPTLSDRLDTATIERIVGYLRSGGAPAFTRTRYTANIDPFWFSSPVRRGILWEGIARLVELDPGYGTDDEC